MPVSPPGINAFRVANNDYPRRPVNATTVPERLSHFHSRIPAMTAEGFPEDPPTITATSRRRRISGGDVSSPG